MGNCASEEKKTSAPQKDKKPNPSPSSNKPKPTQKPEPKEEVKPAPKEEPKPAKEEPKPVEAKPVEPKKEEEAKPEEKKEEKPAEPEPVEEPKPEPVPEPEPVKEPVQEEPKEPETKPLDAPVQEGSMTAPHIMGSPEKKEPEKKGRIVRTLDLDGVKSRVSADTSRYTLGERLGKGAYGTVVRAVNNETQEVVAVKRISKALLAKEGEAGEQRLYREVAIMGSLHHPNLVNLNELLYKEADNEMWIVVEFVDGDELMKKITVGKHLNEETARDYFQQLVVGINYVHSQGVVHRDLKPENILITKDGICKITDFGLSNIQNTDTLGAVPSNLNMQTCCGTPYYVAPEVVTKSKGYSGFTADVWSLGIILYVMLVGDLPFTAKDLPTLLRKIGKGSYEIPPGSELSDSAKDIIREILNPKANKRVKIPEIVEHPWFNVNFDKSRLEVKEQLDAKAVEHLTKTMGDWGSAKKKAEEEQANQAQTMALPGKGNNREMYEEMVKNMNAK